MVCHLELVEANALVATWHRHHKPARGHRFSVGVEHGGRVVGAAIVGRPVSRGVDWRRVVEVTRLVTDGTKNACSALYAAAARAAKELGYDKIQTYILDSEPGVSLRAAGWTLEDDSCGGRQWVHTKGPPRRTDQPTCKKQRWVKVLREEAVA